MKDALDRLLRDGAARPRVLPLAGGLPAEVQFPRRDLAASFLRVLRAPEALQYGWPEGQHPLRAQIAARLRARGADLTADDILITNGAQQAIAIATQLVCRPGHTMGVDQVTYPSALDLFRSLGVLPVTGANATAFYVMPVVGNPGGRQLSTHERHWLVSQSRAFVIEDDAYADLRFAGPAGPPLLAEARGRTFHVGTLSKILCPGLRVGWLVPPRRYRDRAFKLKQASDLQAGGLAQAVAGDFLTHDDLERRLVRLRRFYRARAGRLLRALEKHAPFWRVQPPAGGFGLWVETEAAPSSEESFLALALEEGVSFDPGSSFRPDESETPLAFRVCFSAADPETFEEAVRRLVRAWRRALAAPSRHRHQGVGKSRERGTPGRRLDLMSHRAEARRDSAFVTLR